MPPPSFRYYELMAAKEFGYKLSDWSREDKRFRAEAIAWIIEDSLRESIRMEEVKEKSSSEGGGSGSNLNAAAASNAIRHHFWGV